MFNRDSDNLFCTNNREGSHHNAVHKSVRLVVWQSLRVGGHVGVGLSVGKVIVSLCIVSRVSIAVVIAVKTFVVLGIRIIAAIGVGIVSGVIVAGITVISWVRGITVIIEAFVILTISVITVGIRVITLLVFSVVAIGVCVGVIAVGSVSRVVSQCTHQSRVLSKLLI